MPSDLQTLTDAQLAERAGACMGWVYHPAVERVVSDCPRVVEVCLNAFWRTRDGSREWDAAYSPATDDAQAAELMRFAVEKCGAARFVAALSDLWPEDGPLETDEFFATADARARTIAAISCLESTNPQPESEGE